MAELGQPTIQGQAAEKLRESLVQAYPDASELELDALCQEQLAMGLDYHPDIKTAPALDETNTPEELAIICDPLDTILVGDCVHELARVRSETVDLVVTSPPYADQRKNTYGGVKPDRYVDWFMPIADELYRVLKPGGSFILNIKERVVKGERHTYVIELILEMRKRGWLWTEEYCWHKKNCYPGKWPNRFRDSWERCLHFNKQRKFAMYQEQVMVPVGDWAKSRLRSLSDTDRQRDESRVQSGFGKNVSNWVGRDKVYPTNVLHMATECSNRSHSAVFPIGLPSWFIELFTRPDDLVLDPFMGSGTTAVAAKGLGRHYLGVELLREYVDEANARLEGTEWGESIDE